MRVCAVSQQFDEFHTPKKDHPHIYMTVPPDTYSTFPQFMQFRSQVLLFCVTPAIKQIGLFAGFILQPQFETSENRPRPTTIHTERDESSQTHLTVFTTRQSFRDKENARAR